MLFKLSTTLLKQTCHPFLGHDPLSAVFHWCPTPTRPICCLENKVCPLENPSHVCADESENTFVKQIVDVD